MRQYYHEDNTCNNTERKQFLFSFTSKSLTSQINANHGQILLNAFWWFIPNWDTPHSKISTVLSKCDIRNVRNQVRMHQSTRTKYVLCNLVSNYKFDFCVLVFFFKRKKSLPGKLQSLWRRWELITRTQKLDGVGWIKFITAFCWPATWRHLTSLQKWQTKWKKWNLEISYRRKFTGRKNLPPNTHRTH